jgi:hypothetical protein
MSGRKIEKYGVQATTPNIITVWKNGDKFDAGTQLILKNFKTLDQIHRQLAEKLQMLPAVRLYTVDGKLVKSLDELGNKGNFVAVKQGTPMKDTTLPAQCPKPTPAPQAAAA